MHARMLVIALIGGLFAWRCARPVPEPANVMAGAPHVTWVLMYGDSFNSADDKVACQSDPRSDCVLPASRQGQQVFSDIHIYYHGVGNETRYQGTRTTGYFQGSPSTHTSKVNVSVNKNEAIGNESVKGIVTSTPGTYALTFSLTATVTDGSKTYPVQETIRVVVK